MQEVPKAMTKLSKVERARIGGEAEKLVFELWPYEQLIHEHESIHVNCTIKTIADFAAKTIADFAAEQVVLAVEECARRLETIDGQPCGYRVLDIIQEWLLTGGTDRLHVAIVNLLKDRAAAIRAQFSDDAGG